jgi:hypothetical protein
VGRTLLDLVSATRTDRLRIGRDLLSRAAEMTAGMRQATPPGPTVQVDRAAQPGQPVRASRGRRAAIPEPAPVAESEELDVPGPAVRVPAAERRAAALALVAIWRDVVRDLALVRLGEPGDVRQIDLLDDLEAAAQLLPQGFAATHLRRLDVAGERLEGNVSPELVVDALALGWVA